MPEEEAIRAAASTLAGLRLPPTFVADHCIRTLSSQGAMSSAELARHWRVAAEIVAQVLEPLKIAALIESESNRTNLESAQRWRLTAAGQARLATARARTWYAGPLPVSLSEFAATVVESAAPRASRAAITRALSPFSFEPSIADEIGQAFAAGATLLLSGIADDEQPELAGALGALLEGTVPVPQAIFAAGAVFRTFDARIHRPLAAKATPLLADEASDLLRPRESSSPWTSVGRPLVSLAGGVLASDVAPPFDEDARFYIAPAPLMAMGGLLALCDAASSEPEALERLARCWLVPGANGIGILMLRTGERLELPWRAAVVAFASSDDVPERVTHALQYHVDASQLGQQALRDFLTARLPAEIPFSESSVDGIARLMERTDLATRRSAAATARYLADRRAYEGADFAISEQTLSAALQFAAMSPSKPPPLRRAA